MFNQKTVNKSVTSMIMSMAGAVLMLMLLSLQVKAAELKVNIGDIAAGKGHVLVAIYTGNENYLNDTSTQALRVKAINKNESVVFKDLTDGEYAIKLFQDENDNNKLDTNMMGIPKEGYGFSNNVGMFGQPKYTEAKFIVKDNTEISIDLF